MANRIFEWITITASQDIHDFTTLISQQWFEVLRALWARHDSEGYEGTYWSRVVEDRDKIWVWTAWHTKAEYEKQIDTEAHRLLHAKLTALSTSVPTTSLLYFDRESYGRRTLPLQKSWPGVTLAYFKDRVSEEQRAIMSKVRGFHPWIYSPGDSPTRGEHARGLLFPNHDVTMPSSGGPAGAYIFIDHWESPIREVEIRGPDQVALSQGRYISLSENFEKELKDAGCDERVVRHVRFNKILGVNYREPPVKGESIDYDWEEGKRDRAFELRWMADRDANGDTQHSLRTM